MGRFRAACMAALNSQNWVAALTTALMMVEACAAAEDPGIGKSQKRYMAWWAKHMAGRLRDNVLPVDAYLLRCGLLHAGTDVVEGKHARDELQRFRFTAGSQGPRPSVANVNGVLIIDVAQFCSAIMEGVVEWESGPGQTEVVLKNLSGLISVHDYRNGPLQIDGVTITG